MGAPDTGLRFDRSAWLGTQLGSSIWMAIAAVALAPAAPLAAAAVLGCFLAANGFGWLLWRRRERLDPLRATRALVLAVGLASLLALGAAHASGAWSRLEVGGHVPPGLAYAAVVAITTVVWLLLGRRRAQP
jgi:hypothetical protein